jgi:hypothetical protein
MRQSREVKSGVVEAKGIAEASQWCLVWEITACLVNLWPSGDVVGVDVMTCLVQISYKLRHIIEGVETRAPKGGQR